MSAIKSKSKGRRRKTNWMRQDHVLNMRASRELQKGTCSSASARRKITVVLNVGCISESPGASKSPTRPYSRPITSESLGMEPGIGRFQSFPR